MADGKMDNSGSGQSVSTPERHRPGRQSLVQKYIIDYTNNTTLHGLKYIGEPGRSWTERIWWTIMFISSLVLCVILIHKVWVKWDQSPVIVSFAETSTPVWQVPFPAVTICSETKARQTIYNFTDGFHNRQSGNLTEQELQVFEDVSLVCDSHLLKEGRNITNYTTVENLIEFAPEYDEMLFACKWKDENIVNCTSLFTPILTEEGLCYAFNVLDVEELFRTENLQKEYELLEAGTKSEGWSLDSGYPKHVPMETYPFRGTGYGAKAGLTILLRAYEEDLDYLCRGPVQGFKILLHNPAEVPRLSQEYFRAPLSQEVVVAVKPNIMTTSEGLRSYDPKRRQCYFQNERYLRFFKVYTQPNCELECLTNYTEARCGCVQFSMPRDNTTLICGAGKTTCVSRAQSEIVTHEIKVVLGTTDRTDPAEVIAASCACLPACTSIEYGAETSQADFDWDQLFQAYKIKYDRPGMRMARIMIFFKEAQFITSRRSELYGLTDFLANCGGLLGLFLGFSILSLAEIIYYLSLRICCNIMKRASKKSYLASNFEILDSGTRTKKYND